MRSRKGKAYWQTGHEILKKAATTGPRAKASRKENFSPLIVGKLNSGAEIPADRAAILRSSSCFPLYSKEGTRPDALSARKIQTFDRRHHRPCPECRPVFGYSSNPAARRIFRASPVSGSVQTRRLRTHRPLVSG